MSKANHTIMQNRTTASVVNLMKAVQRNIRLIAAGYLFVIAGLLTLSSCQKQIEVNRPAFPVGTDSTYTPGDTITYEVITTDREGWFGVWNEGSGKLNGSVLDSGSFGSPVYLPSGWRFAFVPGATANQSFISVAAKSFNDDITVNIYKNGALLKTNTNFPMRGMARILAETDPPKLVGTDAQPILTYEVITTSYDTTKFNYTAWLGIWADADGINQTVHQYLLGDFSMPSGWRYSFIPDHLPFTMSMQAYPYTPNGALITTNFYKNNVLVKSTSSRDLVYPPPTFEVK